MPNPRKAGACTSPNETQQPMDRGPSRRPGLTMLARLFRGPPPGRRPRRQPAAGRRGPHPERGAGGGLRPDGAGRVRGAHVPARGVWLAYSQTLSAADVAKLHTLADDHDDIIATPYKGLAPGVAVVVTAAAAGLTGSDMRAHVASRLAAYKVPDEVHVRHESLPRHPAGKLLKSTLKREYALMNL